MLDGRRLDELREEILKRTGLLSSSTLLQVRSMNYLNYLCRDVRYVRYVVKRKDGIGGNWGVSGGRSEVVL